MVVETRNSSVLKMTSTGYTDVAKKLESSALTAETKQIFRLVIELFKSVTGARDKKVAEVEQKMVLYKSESDQKINDMQVQINELRVDLLAAKTEIKELRTNARNLRDSQDEHDTYVRRESLIFSGNKVKSAKSDENCAEIARKLIRTELNLPLDPLISTAHRLGKPPSPNSSAPDKRDIVVRFCRRDEKFMILKAARAKKVEGLYVNESLTATRRKILYALRQMRKINRGPVTGTSTHNGRVFVFTKPAPNAPDGSRSIRTEINTWEKLEDFSTNFVKKPLGSFLASTG